MKHAPSEGSWLVLVVESVGMMAFSLLMAACRPVVRGNLCHESWRSYEKGHRGCRRCHSKIGITGMDGDISYQNSFSIFIYALMRYDDESKICTNSCNMMTWHCFKDLVSVARSHKTSWNSMEFWLNP